MYYRHRFPTEIISYAVWLYFTFPLSFRDVQKLLLYRGIEVSYETIRAWGKKFAQRFAKALRYRRSSVRDKWHLDEVRSLSTEWCFGCGELWMTKEMCWTF